MKIRFFETAICCGLMLSGVAAFGQDRDDHYRDDERFHRDHRDPSYWANRLFERVREDVDHLQSVAPIFSGEQFRLAKTRHDLDELQSGAAAGRNNEHELDEVIGSLQRVAGDRRISDRDRDMINDDLNRLREFREHHERYYH